ncbi:MAG TPA: bifunctional phosphoribosylaminoimidazolecarboxamide formyltransferase/IMP cyclohydrolase [Candidatus Kapabacteria bacterium]|nr:bifunctional phosphoribosylaminoimidazolecarboxamide formyltransferase/IMP cyclohydrolase [Candidatus Kapabacteria bacterium]
MVAQSQEKTKPAIDRVPIRRALISVYDKTGLDVLARALAARGVELYSTGGTEKYLKSLGLSVISISEFTQSPEIFGGRLKTLHPMVHGGLLFRRDVSSHIEEAEANGILPIDLLVVNLYPFEETVARPGATEAEIIEQIDIGGPAMLRSAAKNFEAVAVLTSPEQYKDFMDTMDAVDGASNLALRKSLAMEGFERVAQYDRAIANYFNSVPSNGAEHPAERLEISLPLLQSLRYGENPHQSAALYGEDFPKICSQLWGKELSYNNLLDISSALGLMAEFLPADAKRPVAGIFKHTNPCGVAEGANLLEAFDRAFATDPESPFGGIIIVNTRLDAALAERLNQFFSEVILAPEYDEAALELLKKKKDRRLLTFAPDELRVTLSSMRELRSVVGGVLLQTPDSEFVTNSALTSVTTHSVTEIMQRGLLFAMKIAKHLKSNAIAFCGEENGFARTLGLGAGQTSRVEATRIAIEHAKRHRLSLEGSFVASDAFYPFADSMVEAANAGARAVIEPGGSIRDAEVIQAAEERGIALVMTGIRHFHH